MDDDLEIVRLWELWRDVEAYGTTAYATRKISETEYWLLKGAFPGFHVHKWMHRDAENGEFDNLTKALIARQKTKEPQVGAAKKKPDRLNQEELRRVQLGWKADYDGQTLTNFMKTVNRENSKFLEAKMYGRIMPIVNSSGVGKSRLVDEYSKKKLGIVYTLRQDHESGYPPGDPEIYHFLRHRPEKPQEPYLEHARVVSLFAASIITVSEMFDTMNDLDKDNFPILFHAEMAPLKMEAPPTSSGKERMADRISGTRSPYRQDFCRSVIVRARSNFERFANDLTWVPLYAKDQINYANLQKHALVNDLLLSPLANFITKLRNTEHGRTGTVMFFAIDEISNLHIPDQETGHAELNIPVALKRVTALMVKEPVWTFVLSTKKPPTFLAPSSKSDSSRRISTAELVQVRPFFAFTFSIGERNKMRNDRAAQLKIPLAKFSLAAHICQTGRPLWQTYGTNGEDGYISEQGLRSMVMQKLLDKGDGEPNCTGTTHCLALLSSRLTLDLVFNSEGSADFEETLIHRNLRVISDIHPTTGYAKSCWLEEPIVSEAVSNWFRLDTLKKWNAVVTKCYNDCITVGMVDRSRTGELCGQIVFLVGRDLLFRSNEQGSKFMSNDEEHLRCAGLFTLKELLTSTFTHSQLLLTTPAQMYTAKGLVGDTKITVTSHLAHGYLNYNHFVDTSETLSAATLPDFLHGLLLHQAGAQIRPGQAGLDLLIPVYCGNPNEPFDKSKLGAIAIQMKNRDKKSQWHLDSKKLGDNLRAIIPAGMPVLAIMLEMGLDTSNRRKPVEATPSFRKTIFAFRICDQGTKTYKYMTRDFQDTLRRVLDFTQYESTDIQAKVSAGNVPFKFHSFADRFPEDEEEEEEESSEEESLEEGGGEEEGIPMEGSDAESSEDGDSDDE